MATVFYKVKDNVTTNLTNSVTAIATTFNVVTAGLLPSLSGSEITIITVYQSATPTTTTLFEKMKVTGISGSTLTVERGYLGTTALPFSAGDLVVGNVMAQHISELQGVVNTLEDATVPTAKIEDSAVTTAKILDNNVTNAKLAQVATATVKGRAAAGTGNVEDLVIDADLSSVSALDDTIPSAKATKAYVDILDLKTRVRNAGLINGFVIPSVTSNNLTLSLSTSPSSVVAPTASNPVYVWINGALESITSALTATANAGTNWFGSGASELATQQIDYFPCIGKLTSGGALELGFSRLPSFRLGSEASTTTTNEKYIRFSTGTSPANFTEIINIGRFAATLSATASFNWSVPTFTNANLIQEPIYESRELTWQPTYSGSGSMTYTSVTTTEALYRVLPNGLFRIQLFTQGTTGGTASQNLNATLPFQGGAGARQRFTMISQDDTLSGVASCSVSGNVLSVSNYPNGSGSVPNFGLGTNRRIIGNAIIEIR